MVAYLDFEQRVLSQSLQYPPNHPRYHEKLTLSVNLQQKRQGLQNKGFGFPLLLTAK